MIPDPDPSETTAPQRSSAPAGSPLRTAYSRAEISEKAKAWLGDLWGDEPKDLSHEKREIFHADLGLLYSFICDHFPSENDKDLARRALDSE